MRISDWSSDVCSSDLHPDAGEHRGHRLADALVVHVAIVRAVQGHREALGVAGLGKQRLGLLGIVGQTLVQLRIEAVDLRREHQVGGCRGAAHDLVLDRLRSEEHTSELQSLMRISYAVFCLKKTKKQTKRSNTPI